MTDRPAEDPARERVEAPVEEAKDPVAEGPRGRVVPADPVAAQDEPPALHRVASLAAVSAALAGALGAPVLSACLATGRFGRVDLAFVLATAATLAVCAGFLAAAAGLSRRVRRALRLPLLAAAALAVTFLGAAAAGWVHGFGRGGHAEGWAELVEQVGRLASDSFSRAIIGASLPPFLLLGALSAGVVPGLSRPPRLVWSALGGALGGASFVVCIWTTRGHVDSEAGRIFGTFTLTAAAVGVALNLAERLEPRLAAALRRRAVGD